MLHIIDYVIQLILNSLTKLDLVWLMGIPFALPSRFYI